LVIPRPRFEGEGKGNGRMGGLWVCEGGWVGMKGGKVDEKGEGI